MTIHFAAARTRRPWQTISARALILPGRAPLGAANDNTRTGLQGQILRAALEHFAACGLGAGAAAAGRARACLADGDRSGFEHWLAVCRALDRRRAARLEREIEKAVR